MSHVTSMVVLCDEDEWSEPHDILIKEGFVEVTQHAGGPKYPQADCYMGAFNYFDEEILWAKLKHLVWNTPPYIFINRENEDGWSQWTAKNCMHSYYRDNGPPGTNGSGIDCTYEGPNAHEPTDKCQWCKENVK